MTLTMHRANKRITAALLALIFGLTLVLSVASAAPAESPFGVYVQDNAQMLDSQTQNLLYRNAVWLQQASGTAQVGVVTVASLDNNTIEDLAVSTFRKLGLGDKQKNDGVLLIYAKQENRVRIEVGYGLEGAITDGTAGAILDSFFLPYMKKGQAAQAFVAAQTAIIRLVAKEYNIDPAEMDRQGIPQITAPSGQAKQSMPGYMKLLLGLIVVILLILDFRFTGGMFTFAILSMLRRGGGGGGGFGGGRGGGGSSGGGGASR